MGEVQGRAGAKLVGDILKKKRVVMITLQNDFGKSLADGFREAAPKFGVEVVAEYEYSMKDRQFGPIVSRVKADAAEVIYASGYYFTAGPLVSQLRAAGIEAPALGQERSAERRVGKGRFSTCRSRVSPYNQKKKEQYKTRTP